MALAATMAAMERGKGPGGPGGAGAATGGGGGAIGGGGLWGGGGARRFLILRFMTSSQVKIRHTGAHSTTNF